MSKKNYRTAPYNEMSLAGLSRLHLLSLYAEANYSIDFDECGNEWCVTITYPSIGGETTKPSMMLENALDDSIEILEKFMEEHKIHYPSSTEIATKAARIDSEVVLRYTRKQVQQWRDDIARACAEIAERFNADPFLVNAIAAMAKSPVLRPRPINPAVEVIGYEMSCYHESNTVTYGWQPWQQINESEYCDILEYISKGYKYRVRKVYAEVESYPDDRPNCPICHCRYLALHSSTCEIGKRNTRHVFINYVDPTGE